jgi:hypothetical protein
LIELTEKGREGAHYLDIKMLITTKSIFNLLILTSKFRIFSTSSIMIIRLRQLLVVGIFWIWQVGLRIIGTEEIASWEKPIGWWRSMGDKILILLDWKAIILIWRFFCRIKLAF